MRGLWRQGMIWALVIAVAAAGCASRDIALKPPKIPEEIVVPPLADAKFSKPPDYPRGTLNQSDAKRGMGNRPNMNAMNGGMGGMGNMGSMRIPGANGSLSNMGMGGMGMMR